MNVNKYSDSSYQIRVYISESREKRREVGLGDDLVSRLLSALEKLVSVKELLSSSSDFLLLLFPLASIKDVGPGVVGLSEEEEGKKRRGRRGQPREFSI